MKYRHPIFIALLISLCGCNSNDAIVSYEAQVPPATAGYRSRTLPDGETIVEFCYICPTSKCTKSKAESIARDLAKLRAAELCINANRKFVIFTGTSKSSYTIKIPGQASDGKIHEEDAHCAEMGYYVRFSDTATKPGEVSVATSLANELREKYNITLPHTLLTSRLSERAMRDFHSHSLATLPPYLRLPTHSSSRSSNG